MNRSLLSWMAAGGTWGVVIPAAAQPAASTEDAPPLQPVPTDTAAAEAAGPPEVALADEPAPAPPPAAAPAGAHSVEPAGPPPATTASPQPAPMPSAAPVAAAPPSAPAQALPPPEKEAEGTALVVTGSFFGRYEVRDGYARMGVSRARWLEGDTTVYRARLGLSTVPLEITPWLTSGALFLPSEQAHPTDAAAQYSEVQQGYAF